VDEIETFGDVSVSSAALAKQASALSTSRRRIIGMVVERSLQRVATL
jgi:hypothetical protein